LEQTENCVEWLFFTSAYSPEYFQEQVKPAITWLLNTIMRDVRSKPIFCDSFQW